MAWESVWPWSLKHLLYSHLPRRCSNLEGEIQIKEETKITYITKGKIQYCMETYNLSNKIDMVGSISVCVYTEWAVLNQGKIYWFTKLKVEMILASSISGWIHSWSRSVLFFGLGYAVFPLCHQFGGRLSLHGSNIDQKQFSISSSSKCVLPFFCSHQGSGKSKWSRVLLGHSCR